MGDFPDLSRSFHGANCQSGLSDWLHFLWFGFGLLGRSFWANGFMIGPSETQRPNLPSIITNQPSSLKFVANQEKIGKIWKSDISWYIRQQLHGFPKVRLPLAQKKNVASIPPFACPPVLRVPRLWTPKSGSPQGRAPPQIRSQSMVC